MILQRVKPVLPRKNRLCLLRLKLSLVIISCIELGPLLLQLFFGRTNQAISLVQELAASNDIGISRILSGIWNFRLKPIQVILDVIGELEWLLR